MRPPRSLVTVGLLALALAAASLTSASAAPNPYPTAAAGEETSAYLVVFADGTNARAQAALLGQAGAKVPFVYENVFPGVAASLTARQVRTLLSLPFVRILEADGAVTATVDQSNATWGLDRIDQNALPLNQTYSYTSNGTGVTAYVIDTGIAAHSEFTGRLGSGYTAIADGNGTNDCNGHGTHVAGTIGGTTYGVAKNVSLVPVRVLGCSGSGTWSGVVAGMDWVSANASKPAVANMSLGGGLSTAVNDAVARLTASGVSVSVAAGNDNRNACNYSPASAPSAITVGSTTSTDARSSFSNFGSCVDIFAPGSSITSSWLNGGINTISGTSMATPHVVGAAALVLSQFPAYSAAEVAAALTSQATTGVVTSAGTGSPNRLLFTAPIGGGGGGSGGGGTPAPEVAPLAPTNLAASGSKNINLSWTQPANAATIVSYTISIYEGTGRVFASRIENVSGSLRAVTIQGLKGKTTYSFTIKAFGATLSSPESTFSNFVTTK